MKNFKYNHIAFILILTLIFLNGCSTATGGDAEYEADTIAVEGLDTGVKEISVASLRELRQIKLDASYQRTTGTKESYKLQGPLLKDVVALAGGNIDDYEGIGVVGSDGYYCLVPKDIINTTPDLMLALVIDGNAKLDEAVAPAMLGIQGQYGPYWVKKVDKLILYKDIPKKDIKSVWVFDNLTAGIETYDYEYYGSKDKAIEMIQIFSRFDSFDSQAFFTMKSSDGFKKNEVMNMIKPQYYIKIEGEDAPTNIAPYIKLGMNVKNISWFSTNEDSVIIPYQLEKYIDKKIIGGKSGLPLSEVLYELEFESIKNTNFELIAVDGKKTDVSGEALSSSILCINEDKSCSAIFDEKLNIDDIDNLLRIRIKENEEIENTENADGKKEADEKEEIENKKETEVAENTEEDKKSNENQQADEVQNAQEYVEGVEYDLVISLDDKKRGFTLDELKKLTDIKAEGIYSTTNNWPIKKNYVAKGIDLSKLFANIEMDKNIKAITVKAKDGYSCKFTYEQFFNSYYYPNAKNSDTGGEIKTPTILAFESAKDTTDLQAAVEDKLKLFVGQRGINEPNTLAMVENVAYIELSSVDAGKWDSVTCDVNSFEVEKGTKINLVHEYIDNVKIYYTLDGSEPNYNSPVYNPSTSYFQPELTLPITIDDTVTIKAIAIGYGKVDSDVATFEFKVK